MDTSVFDRAATAIGRVPVRFPVGRVQSVGQSHVIVSGLDRVSRLGDPVQIDSDGLARSGEIAHLDGGLARVMLDGPAEGLAAGAVVRLLQRPAFAPDISWIGRVIDPDGLPLDGKPLFSGDIARSLQTQPPAAHERRALGHRLDTGIAVFNTLLPLVRGQRIGLFAGSGVGKSTLIADLARGIDADVIVIALVGERGREVRHFVDDVLGPEGMARAVVVAATSDRAAQVRKRCALSAMTIAEHFRDLGHNVMLFVDSVTRFCEAHRELAVIAGEGTALRGYPASTAPAIAGLCERAGPGVHGTGDITAVFSVLVAGSDMEEPVADMLRGVLDGHVVLDRAIAERGRFPAVDVLRSVSRSLPAAATTVENATIAATRSLMGSYANAELMIQAGLYARGSDPTIDAAIACHDQLETFLAQTDGRKAEAHFAQLRQIVTQARQA